MITYKHLDWKLHIKQVKIKISTSIHYLIAGTWLHVVVLGACTIHSFNPHIHTHPLDWFGFSLIILYEILDLGNTHKSTLDVQSNERY